MCVVPGSHGKRQKKKMMTSGGQSERERGGGGVGIFLTYPTKNMNESMLTFSRVHTLTCWGIKKPRRTQPTLAVASSRSLIFSCMRVLLLLAASFYAAAPKRNTCCGAFVKKRVREGVAFCAACVLWPLTSSTRAGCNFYFSAFCLFAY